MSGNLIKSMLLVSLFSWSSVFSGSTSVELGGRPDTSSMVKVSIETITFDSGSRLDTVDLMIDCNGYEISAFDLVFAYDQTFFNIVEIIPGLLIDSCNWEFFNHHQITISESRQQNGHRAWQITGLAELLPDSTKPRCYGTDQTISLARMIVGRRESITPPDTSIPIQFYWRKCADNTISDKSGNKLLLSNLVFDSNGELLKRSLGISPNLTGAFSRCVKQDSPNPPLRLIDFYNGMIILKDNSLGSKKESTEN